MSYVSLQIVYAFSDLFVSAATLTAVDFPFIFPYSSEDNLLGSWVNSFRFQILADWGSIRASLKKYTVESAQRRGDAYYCFFEDAGITAQYLYDECYPSLNLEGVLRRSYLAQVLPRSEYYFSIGKLIKETNTRCLLTEGVNSANFIALHCCQVYKFVHCTSLHGNFSGRRRFRTGLQNWLFQNWISYFEWVLKSHLSDIHF